MKERHFFHSFFKNGQKVHMVNTQQPTGSKLLPLRTHRPDIKRLKFASGIIYSARATK